MNNPTQHSDHVIEYTTTEIEDMAAWMHCFEAANGHPPKVTDMIGIVEYDPTVPILAMCKSGLAYRGDGGWRLTDQGNTLATNVLSAEQDET